MAGLSVRYANALFELALESGNVDVALEEAVFLRAALMDEDCQRVIAHPEISVAEKMNFIKKVFGGNVSEHLLGFMNVAITKNRESFLLPALSAYVDMINRHKKKTTAQVTSAVPLGESQAAALAAVLSKKLGKQVELVLKVDPYVISGLTIYVDGYLIDRTVKKRFQDLRKDLFVG